MITQTAYWTPDELAGRLGVTPNLVRKMCAAGQLEARRVGKRLWRIPERAIRRAYPELFEEPDQSDRP